MEPGSFLLQGKEWEWTCLSRTAPIRLWRPPVRCSWFFPYSFHSSLAIWSASRAGDVQVGADATALAGENVVSSYHTAATVLDACALSLGLAGFTMTGAGMVGLFVPGGQGLARETLDAAMRVFDMRDSFISSASSGLKRVEGSLPFLIAANAARACDAQGSESVGYRGTAFAVPTTSASEFPAMEGEGIDTEGLEQACGGLEETAAELERISEEAATRKEEAWLADCGAPGRNMQERAGSLSGLSAAENPDFASSITWNPECALARARAYYRWRCENDKPEGSSVEARADAAARRAFYRYALGHLDGARVVDDGEAYYRWRCENDKPEGSSVEARADAAARRAFYRYALGHLDGARVVDDGEGAYTTIEFLPRNSDDVRGTLLYTEEAWPTSMEEHGRTLHFDESCPGARGALRAPASLASLDNGAILECPTCCFGVDDLGRTLHFDESCPGARGALRAPASLASLDNGAILECPTCCFGVDDLGRVPAASTSIDNGFEYHLRAFTKALREYLEAKGRQNEAEAAARGDAERAADAFDRAMATLEGKRPRIAPPGRFGCVSFVLSSDEGKRPRIAPPGRFGCVSFVLSSEYATPDALETSFAASPDVSRRGAMAAAVLATDGISEGGGVLSGFFSSLQERVGSDGVVGLMDGVLDLWGKLLVSYGDAGRGLEEAFDELTRGLGTLVGGWKRHLTSSCEALIARGWVLLGAGWAIG